MAQAISPDATTGRTGPFGLEADRGALLGTLAGACLVVFDFFVVMVCLAPMARSLNASTAQLQLVVSAYALAQGSTVVLGGRLGDRVGQRWLFQIGLGAFALASLGCALASVPWMLVLGRAAQGLAGALVQPQAFAMLSAGVRPARRPQVFGVYAASMAVAGVAGQAIGGVLLDLLGGDAGWRVAIAAVVPACAGAAWLVRRVPSRAAAVRIPLLSSVGLACFCGAVILLLTVAGAGPALASVLVLAAVALAGLMLFVLSERALPGDHRLLPAALVADTAFRSACAGILLFFCSVASLYFVLAVPLAHWLHLGPLQVSLVFSVLGLMFMRGAMGQRTAWLRRRWSTAAPAVLLCGHALLALAAWLGAGTPALASLVAAAAVTGLGLGGCMGALLATAAAAAPASAGAVAGGVVSAVQQFGNALGVSTVGLSAAVLAAGAVSARGVVLVQILCLSLFVLAFAAGRRITATAPVSAQPAGPIGARGASSR